MLLATALRTFLRAVLLGSAAIALENLVLRQHVGLILCFEASRLSRNSKAWAPRFELCGHLDTLVADLDQVYDLSLPDARLILGVKGSVSEYELSLFRQRSQEAIRIKAKRGALQRTLPAGLG